MFLPRINAEIATFKGQWNKHGLSTENGKYPEELFTHHSGDATAVRDVFDSDGIPAMTPPTGSSAGRDHIPGRTRVDVPRLDVMFSEDQLEAIKSSVDPLAVSEDHGMTLYLQARQLAHHLLG